MNHRYFRVDVVCESLQIPRAQLRRYERMGLIAPSGTPELPGGTSRYTEDDLRRVRRIRRLQRDLGLDLAGVEVVVRLLDQIDDLRSRLGELESDDASPHRSPNKKQQ